jgi:pentatricopeptide repeat protein
MTWITRTLAASVALLALAPGQSMAQDANNELREKAISLNRITGDEATITKLRELRKDKEALKKLIAEALALSKEKEKETPLNYTANFILARAAQSIKDYDDSEYFYKQCYERAFKLHSLQKKAQVLDGLSLLFEQAKKFDDAYFTCQKYVELKSETDAPDNEIENSKAFIIERMIRIHCRKKEFDKALEMTDKMLELTDNGWYFMYRKAEVLREAGKFEESVKAFNDTIEKLDDNDKLKNEDKKNFTEQCKYMLSSVYVDLKDLDKSIKILEELVAARPDNASFQNDLGYILADNDRRLDEAEKLVEKALDLDKAERKKLVSEGLIAQDEDVANSAYLDSLAWVHFKKKNYAKALELMQEVVKQDDSQHVEIYDHLAEIHMAMGQKAEAIKAWEKAVTLENVTTRDDERKAAIKKKLETIKQ